MSYKPKVLEIAAGGTNAATAATARTSLGVPALAGNLTLIQSQVASSQTSLAFTTGITGYDIYFISVYNYVVSSNGNNLYIQYSTNAGSTYINSGYTGQSNYSDNAGLASSTYSISGAGAILTIGGDGSDDTTWPLTMYAYIYGLNSNTLKKNTISNWQTNTVQGLRVGHTATVCTSTSIITGIKFLSDPSANFSGTFNLYGVN